MAAVAADVYKLIAHSPADQMDREELLLQPEANPQPRKEPWEPREAPALLACARAAFPSHLQSSLLGDGIRRNLSWD